MRKWSIGIWLLVGIVAVSAGLLGTWYFRDRMQYGFSQLVGIGISGTTLAFFGTIRKETIRWQDNRIRKIENTGSALDYYNDKIRQLVIEFLNEFDRQVEPISRTGKKHRLSDGEVLELKTEIAMRIGLATILHHIDKLAWLLDQNGYLTEKEILYAITSETSRLLVSESYQPIIAAILEHSTLKHVATLIEKLEGADFNDRTR